jgi:hypothetical protein
MRFLKNFLMSIGAVALVAALLNLFAPQAVHATVTALVEVSNTAANPALTSRIDDPGRIPYAASYVWPSNSNNFGNSSGPVPANHRLVIEQISGEVQLNAASGAGFCQVFTNIPAHGLSTINFPTGSAVTIQGFGLYLFFDQRVQLYVDQNQTYGLNCVSPGPAINGNVTVTGYLLDCNAGPCAPFADF